MSLRRKSERLASESRIRIKTRASGCLPSSYKPTKHLTNLFSCFHVLGLRKDDADIIYFHGVPLPGADLLPVADGVVTRK